MSPVLQCGNRGELFIRKGQKRYFAWQNLNKTKVQLRLCPRLPVGKQKKKRLTATECGSSQKYSRQEIPHSATGLKVLEPSECSTVQ